MKLTLSLFQLKQDEKIVVREAPQSLGHSVSIRQQMVDGETKVVLVPIGEPLDWVEVRHVNVSHFRAHMSMKIPNQSQRRIIEGKKLTCVSASPFSGIPCCSTLPSGTPCTETDVRLGEGCEGNSYTQ